MGPSSSSEHIKQFGGWTFKQWAAAAAWVFTRQYPIPQPTADALLNIQRVWNSYRYGSPDAHGLTPLMVDGQNLYAWAWTCAAMAHAAEECKRLGTYRLDRKP